MIADHDVGISGLRLIRIWLVVVSLAVAVNVGVLLSQVSRINASRLEICKDGNERHRTAVRRLDEEVARLPPEERARAEARRDGTVRLIDALVPERNCDALP
jgi:hypothetical protein